MSKKKLLFTLILMVSCLGILGMGEKGEAASCNDLYCVTGDKCYKGDVACEDNKPSIVTNKPTYAVYGCFRETAKKYKITCNAADFTCISSTLSKSNDNECYDFCCRLWKGENCKCNEKDKCVFTGACEEECVDISKCTGGAIVVISSDGPTDCSSGSTCVKRGSCQIASTVPQLPTNANTTPATSTTPTNSITVSEPTTSSGGTTVNLSDKKLSEILEDLIKWLLKIVILIAILMIIVSGAMYMISAGDQQKVDTAKKALTYAILGLLVVVLAYAIVDTLVDILAG